MLAIVALSAALVHFSIELVHQTHIPASVIGIFVLPIATSLPNTWAALALARRGLGDALISATLNSNSINLLFGIAIPSLFVKLHPGNLESRFDAPYLLGMTTVVCAVALWGRRVSRRDGGLVIALYLLFVVIRLALGR
jgi:cation:H+ antiporter